MKELIDKLLSENNVSTILALGMEALMEKVYITVYESAYDEGFDAGYKEAENDFVKAS